nr:meiotic recombination protein REC114 isoform X5 [Equus asinus]
MAEAGKEQAGLGLPGGGAAQWPLQRYGRFIPSGAGESPGPGLEPGTASSLTWKVFESNEESGYLVLTIVISGHFFISQGQTLLEGFSLIGSKNWLKIVRRMDCLLFGTTIKNKSRMFRVQFSGGSKEQALEHCCSCVQTLAQYLTVQVPDGIRQDLRLSPAPLRPVTPDLGAAAVWTRRHKRARRKDLSGLLSSVSLKKTVKTERDQVHLLLLRD